jgi:SWI/SNF-related matrix-associated actin-dependent regulator 1 of chromatin subfamily A
MHVKLYPYQEIGVDWLSERRFALLADEMGLGKSAQTIRAADNILADRVLVVCPAVARENWLREFEKFSMLHRQFVVRDSPLKMPQRGKSFICSYDGAVSMNKGNWWKGGFDLIILDEAHYLKNPQAERTQQILGKDGIAHKSGRTWATTGTPMPNNPAELWVLLRTFGVIDYGYDSFVDKWCQTIDGYKGHSRIVGARVGTQDILRKVLAPIMLRRTVEQVMPQLPTISFNDLVIEPGNVEIPPDRLKEKLEQEEWLAKMLLDENSQITPAKMRLLEVLANSVSTLRWYCGMQKVQPVADMVNDELANNEYKKIVIFGVHTAVLHGLYKLLLRWKPAFIVGSTTPIARERDIERFQEEDSCRAFICNIQAAGIAVNLTAANQVLFVESEWSPGPNQQAVRRCRRIGSKLPVFARFVGIANSIDEKIAKVNARKTRDIDAIIG